MDAEQKKARNAALAKAYEGGARVADLAKMSGMTAANVRNIIKAQGVELRGTMTGGARKFDDATEAQITADYAAGEGSTTLAKRYGISDSGVRNIVLRNGGAMRPVGHANSGNYKFDSATESRICDEYRAGDSQTVLSKRYGVAEGTIWGILERHGVESLRPRGRDAEKVERNQRIADEFTAGVGAKELGRRYGLHETRIRKIVREVCDAEPAKQRVMEDLGETFQLVPDEQAMQSTAPEYVGPFGRPATDAQRSAIEEYKAGGLARDIAERHGMTLGKLYSLAKLNGLYRQGLQNLERDRRIVDALVAGEKPDAIAEEYGFTVYNVYRIAKQHGISRDAIANGVPLADLVREPKVEPTDTGIVRGEREPAPKVVPIKPTPKAAKAREGIDKVAWAAAGFLAATALSIAASGWFGC